MSHRDNSHSDETNRSALLPFVFMGVIRHFEGDFNRTGTVIGIKTARSVPQGKGPLAARKV
jgi:hypothetical protein